MGDLGRGGGEIPAAMPGILKRRQSSPLVSEIKGASDSPMTEISAGKIHTQQDRPETMNGSSPENRGQGGINGFHDQSATMDMEPAGKQERGHWGGSVGERQPPNVEHITFGYLPLSTLIARLVQDTFNGLNNAINDSWDIKTSSGSDSTYTSSTKLLMNGENAAKSIESNAQRKLRLLHFAQDSRARFIKILVLSRWSRQVESIGRVIDLKVWFDGQRRLFEDAISWMGELKRVLPPMKQPSPDIKMALESLSLGKAPCLSDINYVPRRRLTPREILRGLTRINTLLSIRLRLHTEIPRVLRNFSIASGRATFKVKDEFEVDISIGDEDLSTQLYLIDFRFAFAPATSEVASEPLKDEIRSRCDGILKDQGLKACYDFLHEFVLTFKINVLKRQAFKMSQSEWSANIKVEEVRRSLVVQYWLNRPGPKSWVEIGVRKGSHRGSLAEVEDHEPHLGLRWFRHGREVANALFSFDVGNLSMAKILKEAIAKHTNHVLSSVKEKIKTSPLYAQKMFHIRHKAKSKEHGDSSLLMQLTPTKAVKLVQETITGQFALLPPLKEFNKFADDVNRLQDPATEIAMHLANLRCTASQKEICDLASDLGFLQFSFEPKRAALERHFGRATSRVSFFYRRSWQRGWLLALSTSMTGDFWWAVSLTTNGGPTTSSNFEITGTWKILLNGSQSMIFSATPSTILQIERLATQLITQQVDLQYVKEQNVRHSLLEPTMRSTYTRLCMHIKPSAAAALLGLQTMSGVWRDDLLCTELHALDCRSHRAMYVCRARLRDPIPNVRRLLKTLTGSLKFQPNSRDFLFLFHCPTGASTVPHLLRQLSRYERLLGLLEALQKNKLSIRSVDIRGLGFVYAEQPNRLQACIILPSGAQDPSVRLLPPNPQIRIQNFLNTLFRSSSSFTALTGILHVLRCTSPIARALDKIEKLNTEAGTFVKVTALAADHFRVDYRDPRVVFLIHLRRRREFHAWHIKYLLDDKAKTDPGFQPLIEALLKVIHQRNGKWKGMTGSAVATIDGIEDFLLKVDEVFRNREDTIKGIAGPANDSGALENDKRKRKADEEVPVAEKPLQSVNKTAKTNQGQSPAAARQLANARPPNPPATGNNPSRPNAQMIPPGGSALGNGFLPNKPAALNQRPNAPGLQQSLRPGHSQGGPSNSTNPRKRKAEDDVVVLD